MYLYKDIVITVLNKCNNLKSMKSYYFFFVPVKDKNICKLNDPSLNSLRVNSSIFKTLFSYVENNDDIHYMLLKSIDEMSLSIRDCDLEQSVLSGDKSELELIDSVLKSFDNNGEDKTRKYLSMAQYPLLVIETHGQQKKLSLHYPKTSLDVYNHCFLHYYQFMKVKQLNEPLKRIESLISVTDSNYSPGISPSAKFATCCLNNVLIEVSSKKILLNEHQCYRSKSEKKTFDSNLYKSIGQLLQ